MKTEKKENKKTGERSDAGGDSEGRRKSSYEEEDTIAVEEIPEEKLESDIKAKFGPNCLTPPHKTPDSSRRCSWGSPCFSGTRQSFAMSPMVSILPMETRVSPDNLYVGVALTLVVIVSGLFTYYQENKSSKIMESFAKLIPPNARVFREGTKVDIEAIDLVVGDIVDIQGGDKTPADIRMIESHGLKVDNSSLTGESVRVLWPWIIPSI